MLGFLAWALVITLMLVVPVVLLLTQGDIEATEDDPDDVQWELDHIIESDQGQS